MALPTRTRDELERAVTGLRQRIGGARLAILARNSWSAVVAREAAIAAGATAVPLNPLLTPSEIEPLLRAARADQLLCDVSERERASRLAAAVGLDVTVIDDSDDGAALRIAGGVPRPCTGEHIGATIVFTSGTTGVAKGCLRGADCEAARAASLVDTFSITESDVHLLSNPLAHSAPGIFYRAAACRGADTLLLPRFRASEFLRVAAEERATFCFLVPTQLGRLLAAVREERDALDLSSLRALIVAGSLLRPALRRQALDWLGSGRLWEFYGSSETGTITVLQPDEQHTHADSVGRAAPGVAIELRGIDDSGCGEVHVKSSSVMDGYLDDRGDRIAIAADGFVATGDIGHIDDRGYLRLRGRKGDLIITGGVNVYPAEVERALCESPAVAAAVVTGVPDDDWGQRVVALIATTDDSVSDEEILRAARERLAGYKLPKNIVRVDLASMPIGPSGKPLRRRARDIVARSLAGE